MCPNASTGSSDEPAGVQKKDGEEPNRRAKTLRRMVGFYQEYVSGLKMGPSCRFQPTCSNYALTALARHGAVKGLLLSIGRLLRCAPWHPGGWDPVPPAKKR